MSTPATASASSERLLGEGRWAVLLLICAGIWLHSADITVVATVLPAAVAELGGAAWVAWAWVLELVGAIVASAGCGLVAARHGVGKSAAAVAAIFAVGCAITALAWDMGGFLAGRLLQGIGGGALVALCYIGVATSFPERLWARAYAIVSVVWGVSAMVGPLVGGLFAEAGFWQGAFWTFAGQAVAIVVAAPALLRRGSAQGKRGAPGLPLPSLLLLVPGVLAIGVTGVLDRWWLALPTALAGLGLLMALLAVERRAPVALLPQRSLGRGQVRAGLLMAFLLALAAISFSTYGPLLLQRLHGLTPLEFGYLTALESVAWSAAALAVGHWPPSRERMLIRVGALTIVAGIALFAATLPHGPLWAVVVAAVLQGGGFGLSFGFVTRRVVAAAAENERERAAGALPTLQMLGYSLGAAAAGIVANGLGFADAEGGIAVDRSTLETVALWVFLAFLPVGAAGIAAAWRLTR